MNRQNKSPNRKWKFTNFVAILVSAILTVTIIRIYTTRIEKMNYKFIRGYALGYSDEYRIKYEGDKCIILHSHCGNDMVPANNQSPKYIEVEKKTLSRLSSVIIIYAFEYARTNYTMPLEYSDIDGYVDKIEDGSGKMIATTNSSNGISASNILLAIATSIIM